MPVRRELVKQQMTMKERERIDYLVRRCKQSPTDALKDVNDTRSLNEVAPLNKSSVHRYVNGETYKLSLGERRGAKPKLTKLDKLRLDQARRRLAKKADGEYRVTHDMIINEASKTALRSNPCKRVVQDALRADGARYRRPRRKIHISSKDVKIRRAVAEKWVKKPATFWRSKVHAYMDLKKFVLPLTPEQRTKFRQTRVEGHIRKPCEGIEHGFTKPKERHSYIGLPSIEIAAAVAKNRVIMWEVVQGPWNGQKAADLYKGPLLKALKRTWGNLGKFTIIEDGDRKGFQSRKGLAAKEEAKIKAMTLPPRTPSLMPLDFSIWKRIEDIMLEQAPDGRESKADFVQRLKATAKNLPRSFIAKQIDRMKNNLQALCDAKGYTPKND